MSRLIDADEVIEVQMYDEEHEDFYTEKMTVEDYICRYSEMPSVIEAEPVRHGKWIKADSQQYFRKHYPCFTCSACGYRKDSQKKWNYCPNCGARMDEK